MKFLILFLASAIGGMLIETLTARLYYQWAHANYREHHFTFGKYFFYLSIPLLGLVTVALFDSAMVFIFFIIFAVAGPILEWIIGFTYQGIFGQRLWTYHSFPINKYTSWLTLPIWGLSGVLVFVIAQTLTELGIK